MNNAETHVIRGFSLSLGKLLSRIGKLPFPEFDEEERDQLEDILDYPPKGSPGYKPR